MAFLAKFLYSQLFVNLPVPSKSFAGKTIIVTGSNVGLGLEAARHIKRLEASTVILAVRNVEKGEAARQSIIASTGCDASGVQVWQLDLSSYESVKQFAARVSRGLPRLDAIIENAGIATDKFQMFEDNESTITTNVVSTFLLALLVLPKLKETAAKLNTQTNLVIVSSEVHYFTSFPEKSAAQGEIITTLNNSATANMSDRYNVSKLLEVFFVRELATRTARIGDAGSYPVTINFLNPGLCHSELLRDGPWILAVMKFLLARSTEHGSRSLVQAVQAGPETHGEYLSDCVVSDTAPLVRSDEGAVVQKRVYEELTERLDKIQPGIMKNL